MRRDELLALFSSEGFNEVATITREPHGAGDLHPATSTAHAEQYGLEGVSAPVGRN